MKPLASAPGKLIALGEYAVLEGHSALVISVNRRAIAVAKPDAPPLSPFLARAEELCTEVLGPAPVSIRVDTSSFRVGKRKLGLGSSAAATVAYVAARFAGGSDSDSAETRARIHAISHQAHGDVSARGGARGSGADIAASVIGGMFKFTPGSPVPGVRTLPAGETVFVCVDSGAAANTRTLVAQVHELRERDENRYGECISALAAAARSGLDALDAGDSSGLVASFDQGFGAIDALGKAASLALVNPIHRQVAEIAKLYDGAAKPTGAGAGDAALAVFTNKAAAARFCVESKARGIQVLDLSVEFTGVCVFPAASHL